jgi:hypothetical protein
LSKGEAAVKHGHMKPLAPRSKKFIGLLVILAWLFIYCLAAMRVGVAVLPNANGLIKLLYYAIVGTAWIIPIGLMLPWMHREPKKKRARQIIDWH